jgi:Tfp pilus assembly ATPase PilU
MLLFFPFGNKRKAVLRKLSFKLRRASARRLSKQKTEKERAEAMGSENPIRVHQQNIFRGEKTKNFSI